MKTSLRIITCALTLALAAAGGVLGGDPPDTLRLRATRDVRALERVGDSLWIGTTGGLFIYDLGNDRFVDASRVDAWLPPGAVRAIRAKADSVFVGTDGGLAVYADDTLRVLSEKDYDDIPMKRVRAVDVGLHGQIFVGTYGLGLGVISAEGNYEIMRADSLLDNKVYRTVQHDDTTFFYATSMGLCAFRDSLWVNFQAGAGIPRGEILNMVPRGDGGYYLLVGDYGVYQFDGETARRVSKSGLFPEDDVSAITVDADGNLWAAGRFGGIASYVNGRWKPEAKNDPKIWQQTWRCAAAGSENAVFFGAASGIVVVIDQGRMRRIEMPGEMDTGDVRRLTRDGSGVIYFLNSGRVARVGARKLTLGFEPFPPNVADLAVAPGGGLWAAGRWGIFRLDANGFREFPVDTDENDPAFVALAFDEAGSLWVASRTGRIHRYDGLVWMRMGDAGELGLASLDRIVPARGGGVWVFSFSGGGPVAARAKAGRWETWGGETFDGLAPVDAVRAPNGTVVALTKKHVWGFDSVAQAWRKVGPPRGYVGRDSVLTAPPGESFRCASFDAGGRLFVGTGTRVGVLTDTGWLWMGPGDGVDGFAPSTLLAGDGEALWVGFAEDGLLRLPRKSLW